MKVAVVGAGLAGLGASWHLLNESKASITLDIFDSLPPGRGTSGIASGLLHPYTASRAELSWQGEEMMEATHKLLTTASFYAPEPLVTSTGILRLALSSTQMSFFQEAARKQKDCIWLNKEKVSQNFPELRLPEEAGALYIKQGISVNMGLYLQSLLQAILRLGGRFREETISDPSLFEEYDRVIIAAGSEITAFTVFADLPFRKIKGQTLELRWPSNHPPLPMSIVGQTHIVMRPDQKSCLIGATFERNYQETKVDLEIAKKELLEKTISFLPLLREAEIIGAASGIRACPISHRPLLGRLNERFWFFTGLCAKGLLYHSYLGKQIATALLADNSDLLPPALHHHIVLS